MKTTLKQLITAFLKNILFWILLFAFTRLLYLLFNVAFLRDIDFVSIIAVFWHALPLDISTACYLMLIPVLLITIQSIYPMRWLDIVFKAYVFIFVFIFCSIITFEIGVYPEWKTKLHYKALLYLLHPGEILRTAQTWQLIVLFLLIVIQVGGAFIIYTRFFFMKFLKENRTIWLSLCFFILLPGFLFIGMRGGFQQIPINQSKSYFSKIDILNLAAVNSGWNLMHSIEQNANLITENPFKYFNQAEAKKTVRDLYKIEKDSTIQILKIQRPNIVVFILEGWSADLIESTGGEKGITPFFHEMEKQGVLFTNIYNSGDRSQQGMSAIFGGFPAHPITTITEQPEKCNKLPALPRIMSANGYYTSYYFGGDLTYGNIMSYLLQNGFDKIIDEKDFPSNLPRGRLGIHDGFSLPFFLSELNKQKQPFFSNIFTASTHSPYDMGIEESIQWPKYEKQYVNAAYYSDNSFRKFFEDAKKQSWYKNTLFVFISDHGHNTYRNWPPYSANYNKMVFMMCGDVIRDSCKGLKIDKIGAQVDYAATLLNQLHLNDTSFYWSKNLLNVYCPEFAYYPNEEGIGWIRPGAQYVFDTRFNRDILLEIDSANKSISKEQMIKEGKSYLQCVFQQYMDY